MELDRPHLIKLKAEAFHNNWSSSVILVQLDPFSTIVYAFNCTWQWGFPKLKPPKPMPFPIYVFSIAMPCRPEVTHFEMVVDITNFISQGWGSSFAEWSCHHANIIDYPQKLRLLEFSYCDFTSDLYGFSLQDEGQNKLTTLTACTGNLLKASRSFDCATYLHCLQMFRYPDGLLAIEPFNLSLLYDMKFAIAGSIEKGMETDKPIIKKNKTVTARETVEVLPDDYNNWSSTVIFFIDYSSCCEVGVYAVDCDDCVVYYVVSYRVEHKSVCHMVGYAVGDFKVYFVGNIVCDNEDGNPMYSFAVDVYDIRNRRWITDDFPVLNLAKSTPFVFFLDGRLYVLSTDFCRLPAGETHFEMLDFNNLSQGWVFLPDPSSVGHNIWGVNQDAIIDYSKKSFYMRLHDSSYKDISAYSLHDNRWHEVRSPDILTGRMGNLQRIDWSRNDIIVEKYLYRFMVLEYPDGQRATLIIWDLEHITHYDDNEVPFVEVDISSAVAPDVLHDMQAIGYIVYLGKRNSRQRFSLVISYNLYSTLGAYNVCACTFDLRRIGENSAESFIVDACQYQQIKMDRTDIYGCYKLCEFDI